MDLTAVQSMLFAIGYVNQRQHYNIRLIINKLLAADKLCLCSAKYRFNCSCIHL